MQHKLVVWKDKFALGWNGDTAQLENLQLHTVTNTEEALYSEYNTDAHCTLGVVYSKETGEPFTQQVRLNQPALETLRSLGMDVHFSSIAVDVDYKGQDKAGWLVMQHAYHADSNLGGWLYETNGGYRIFWRLPELLTVEKYANVLTALRNILATFNIIVDPLVDWNRAYRLPFVVRNMDDGSKVRQNHPHDPFIPQIPTLDLGVLAGHYEEAAIGLFGMSSGPGKREIVVTKEGGRDDFLFKAVASRMRATPWIGEEMYMPILELYNEFYCEPPLPHSDLERISKSVQRYAGGETDDWADMDVPKVGRIQVKRGGLHEYVQKSIRVLAESPGIVYNRDGSLVWVNRGTTLDAPSRIESIPKAALRGILESLVDFYTVKANKTGGFDEITIDCPKDLIDTLDTQTEYPEVNKLEELLLCPTLDPSGALINRAGYYPSIHSLLIPDPSVANLTVSEHPTFEDARRSLRTLTDLLSDFPFEDDCHRSVALSTIITPVVRTAIEGPVPLILVDSPTPGTGKSLLADIASIIATGQPASRMVWTKEEEFEKRITAILSGGARTVLIDNVDTLLGGASLDAVLTGNYWMGRILGRSEMIRVRIRAQLMATGNNLQVSGDLARRAIRCYLDPGVEDPEARTGFRYANILNHVKERRAVYVEAVLTLVKAWMVSGKTIEGLTPLGSFEHWSEIVRSAIIWVGMPDPVISQRSIKANDVSIVWGSALEAITDIWGDSWFSSRDLYDDAFGGIRVKGAKASHDALTAALEELLGTTIPGQKTISWLLKKWTSRVVGGRRLVRSPQRDRLKGYTFTVEQLGVGAGNEFGDAEQNIS